MKTDFTNPRDWLYFASVDLEAIGLLHENRIAFEVCQSRLAECLEKVIKGELVRNGWRLKKEHDLQWLAKEMETFSPELTLQIHEVVEELADVYFTSRYPGFDLEEPDWERFGLQMKTVLAFYDEVKKLVEPPGNC
jgi:HEPN domain-containing protein